MADEPVNTESPSSEIEQVLDTNNNQREIPANTQTVRQHHDITSENNIEISEGNYSSNILKKINSNLQST